MSRPVPLILKRPTRREALALGVAAAAATLLPGGAVRAQPAAGPLLKRPIPHSGEQLPVVGIGTAIVFDIGDDAAKRAERAKVIETLVAGGGSLIDTAPSYGTAEVVAGDLISRLGLRDRIFLATKVRVAEPAAMEAEMRRSLERLKTDKIDLMQIHNVRNANQEFGPLKEWKDRGVFRYIGITSSFDRDYEALETALKRMKPDFFQINYSIGDRDAEERLIPAAVDVGAAVLTNLPFGRGRLFQKVRGRALPDWAAEIDAGSWAQFFLKYLIGNPAVTAVIPGTDKPEYMVDNLAAGRGRMPDAAMRRRMAALVDSL